MGWQRSEAAEHRDTTCVSVTVGWARCELSASRFTAPSLPGLWWVKRLRHITTASYHALAGAQSGVRARPTHRLFPPGHPEPQPEPRWVSGASRRAAGHKGAAATLEPAPRPVLCPPQEPGDPERKQRSRLRANPPDQAEGPAGPIGGRVQDKGGLKINRSFIQQHKAN